MIRSKGRIKDVWEDDNSVSLELHDGEIYVTNKRTQKSMSKFIASFINRIGQEVTIHHDANKRLILFAHCNSSAIQDEHIIVLQGKKYVTHQGLLAAGHDMGLVSIKSEILQMSMSENWAVVQATVTLIPDGNDEIRIFQGIGDGTKANLPVHMQSSFLRMAETRAINRALRLATKNGMTSIEELPTTEEKH